MDKKKRNALLKLIIDSTEKFAIINGYEKPKYCAAELSEQQKAIIKAAGADFGCANSKIASLVSALSGIPETLLIRSRVMSTVALKKFVAFVALAAANSHNYRLKTVSICCNEPYSNRGCIREDGSNGNDMHNGKAYLRPATREEIENVSDIQLIAATRDVIII